jgi:hypothetical protein
VNHGENIAHGNVNVLTLFVLTEPHSRSTNERTEVVGSLNTVSSSPRDLVLVGEDGSDESSTVVTSETDEHQTVARQIKSVSLRKVKTELKVELTQSWELYEEF